MSVDTRSYETALASKDNIVAPSHLSAAQVTGLELRAGEVQRGQNPPQPSTIAGSGAAANRTNVIRRG